MVVTIPLHRSVYIQKSMVILSLPTCANSLKRNSWLITIVLEPATLLRSPKPRRLLVLSDISIVTASPSFPLHVPLWDSDLITSF
jgi:hypothetical protein